MITEDQLARQLSPFAPPLSDAQLHAVSRYLDLLLKWNARTNLTAVRDAESIVTRHFGESLFAASRLLAPDSSATAIDVGSGAGFPGLPLKIWAPALELTLVESQNKKATFLKEVVRTLGLTVVRVFSARAETLTATAELVTLRAVEQFASVLPVAASLVAPGGRLALLIGAAQAEQARGLLPGFSWADPLEIPNSGSKILLFATKTGVSE